MSTLSATGAWPLASRAFERSLRDLRLWRDAACEALADFRRWALVARLLDEQGAARLAHLERRLASDRLILAFVAEYSRGKSELINALFFAGAGHRLLASGPGSTTLCPTEIAWDPARPPSLRLLPIHTRESEKALREYIHGEEGWTEVPLDPSHPESFAAACEAVSESIEVDAAHAASLGFRVEGDGRVPIPRWRYALLNIPHPLLADGLAILDTPGRAALESEPELTLRRVPDAAAIVFMLSAEAGLEEADRELWNEHIAPIEGLERLSFVVLNKIDALREGRGDGQVLAEIDRQVRLAAEALGVDPTRVFALSARQALAGTLGGDSDALLRSRMYRLEQALARRTVHERRAEHALAVRAELRIAIGEARALAASRLAYAREQMEEIAALQGRNQKLVESLARRASLERARIEQARALVMGLRTAHNRHADELSRLLEPAEVRAEGLRARRAVLDSAFSSGIGEALDGFFAAARSRMQAAIEIIEEARKMMANVGRTIARDHLIDPPEAGDFATDRFLVEIDRLEQRCARDFKGTASLVLHRRKTLGALFFDTVALQVVRVFEIADREVRTWMNAFIRPLESHVSTLQEQANGRIEGMGRIQNAEGDLVARLGELKAIAAEVAAQRDQLEAHFERLRALAEAEPERSLA
ncbi:MAG TPA: dynamin family protein [Usitatibacter sp.]|nr:dynamin family protein [Usitatibacter sp.]